jgi:hypothetical protein
MAALTIDFRCPYRGSLTPFDAISNKLRSLSEIENIKQRNARQCPKLAVDRRPRFAYKRPLSEKQTHKMFI